MNSQAGKDSLGWLLGPGEARGIALAFLGASAVLLVVVLLAFLSRPYRRLSAAYASAPPALHTEEGNAGAEAKVAAPPAGGAVAPAAAADDFVVPGGRGEDTVDDESDGSVRSGAR
jgi:DHA3 family multidrug efflux protein-like MFS transporter